jgi:ankyrin repeat protein
MMHGKIMHGISPANTKLSRGVNKYGFSNAMSMPERRTTIYSPLSAQNLQTPNQTQVRFGANPDDESTENAVDQWFNDLASEAGKLWGRFKKGSDTAQGTQPEEANPNPGVPPEKVATFFNALQTGNLNYLNSHIQQNYPIDVVNEKGQTALMVSAMASAEGKRPEVLNWVLSKNPQVNKQDRRGRNVLMLVLQQKTNPATRLNVVAQLAQLLKDDVAQRSKKLVKEGILSDDKIVQYPETALETAARLKLAPEIKALRAAGWPMNQDLSLLVAIQNKDDETLNALLSSPISFNPADGNPIEIPAVSFVLPEELADQAANLGIQGQAAHVAAASGNVYALEKLASAQVDFNAIDPNVGTPLMQAVQNRQKAAVEKLIALGVDTSIAHPKTNQTAKEMVLNLIVGSTSNMTALSEALAIQELLEGTQAPQNGTDPNTPPNTGGGDQYDGPLF